MFQTEALNGLLMVGGGGGKLDMFSHKQDKPGR